MKNYKNMMNTILSGRFRNCDGRNSHNNMPVVFKIIMIGCSPLHYKQAMWSG